MAHKDLSPFCRAVMRTLAGEAACVVSGRGDSLALAREAWINAFDKAAEELEATDAKDQA